MFLILVTAALSFLSPVLSQEVESYGTGEVNPSVLRVGDHAEVTYRNVEPGSRSRMAEIVGMVVEVTPVFFVVENVDDEAVIEYDTIIRLDRTRNNAWTLDPLDLAIPQDVLIQKYMEGRELEGLEGTWVWDDTTFEIALVANAVGRIPRYDYAGIVIETPIEGWLSGEIKLLLKETATPEIYSAVFITNDRSRQGTTVRIADGRVMETTFPRPYGRTFKRLIHKTYPIPEPVDSADTTEKEPVPIFGSGFFITLSVIATANHLVDTADSIVVSFGQHRLSARVRSRDRRNNLALLTVDASSVPASKMIPATLGDATQMLEGDLVVSSGYASPTSVRPSVAQGIVNNLFGPGEDLTRFTLSESVGPVAAGGPLFSARNTVVGIVLPADTTGTAPVSVAAKSDLLASLLKLSSVDIPVAPQSESTVDTAVIGQMARSSVVLIEAR